MVASTTGWFITIPFIVIYIYIWPPFCISVDLFISTLILLCTVPDPTSSFYGKSSAKHQIFLKNKKHHLVIDKLQAAKETKARDKSTNCD